MRGINTKEAGRLRWRAEEERQARNKGGQTLFRLSLFEAFCPAVAQSHNSCRNTLVDTKRRRSGWGDDSKESSMTPLPWPRWATLCFHQATFPAPPCWSALGAASITFLLQGSKVSSRLDTRTFRKDLKFIQEWVGGGRLPKPPPVLYGQE